MSESQQIEKLEVNFSYSKNDTAITDPEEILKLWDQTFEIENLQLIFNSKVKSDRNGKLKKSVGLDFITLESFEKDLIENLKLISRKVKNNTYKFTRFKLILINKGPGKAPRELRIPTVRDRITITAMAEFARKVLGPGCEIPKGRNIIKSIIEEKNKYNGFVKTDISQFFKSIPHPELLEMLRDKFFHGNIIELFHRCISTGALELPQTALRNPREPNKKGIPEGLSFCGFLANIYLENLDRKFEARKDLKYYRYVDDIMILVNYDISKQIRDELKSEMASLKLDLSDGKTQTGLITDKFDYLGYSFDGNLITLRESSVAKCQNSLARFIRDIAIKLNKQIKKLKEVHQDENSEKFIYYKQIFYEQAQTAINRKITGFKSGPVYYSWLNYYRLLNDLTLLGTLDGMVAKLLKKYKLDQHIKPKKYIKTYNELIHNPDTKYIPDYTGIYKFIFSHKEDDETSKKKYEFSLSGDVIKEFAKLLGWHREKSNYKLKNFFVDAISLAVSEGYKIQIIDGKINIDLITLKRKIISALNHDIEDF